jgi:Zn-dependent alcohol dehydrogenase
LTTGFGTITNDAQVRIGESVVVIGCGGIGLGAVLGASLAGAFPVIAVDLFDHKLETAKKFGATHTVNSKETDFRVAAETILGGKGDVVIDGTGLPAVLQEALALTAPKGRCVGIGVMPWDKSLSLNTLQLHFGKVLTGSEGGASKPACPQGSAATCLAARDRPGAAAGIATRMAEHSISLESIVQKRPPASRAADPAGKTGEPVPVVLITYATTEEAIRRALDAMMADGHIAEPPQLIRIERG